MNLRQTIWLTGLMTAGIVFLALSIARGGTVTLAWDASAGTNVIANYKVYYGVATRTYTNSVSAGTNLTASVPNLIAGMTYYFAATAVDTGGLESDYSAEVSTVISNPTLRLTVQSKLSTGNAWSDTGMSWGVPATNSQQLFRLRISAP